MIEMKAFTMTVHSVSTDGAVELIEDGGNTLIASAGVKNVSGKQLYKGQRVIVHFRVDKDGKHSALTAGNPMYITATLC